MLCKKAIVVHSGGMDSSICLALAMQEFGKEHVLSLSFSYQQRHTVELQQAAKISTDWEVEHYVIQLDCLKEITQSALMDPSIAIVHEQGHLPNTLLVGRNGLMAAIASIHAHHLGANCIYMGVMELEGANSGYRDCSRHYMDLVQTMMRIDLANPEFEIRTPLVHLYKKDTMALAHRIGLLTYLLNETITCYEGIGRQGCRKCPACKLRNEGIALFRQENPHVQLPY